MGNMSYCRFENTMNDFNDCIENIDSLDHESTAEEFIARRELILGAQRLLLKLGVEDLYDINKIETVINELDANFTEYE